MYLRNPTASMVRFTLERYYEILEPSRMAIASWVI
jgi:hypothetical protein